MTGDGDTDDGPTRPHRGLIGRLTAAAKDAAADVAEAADRLEDRAEDLGRNWLRTDDNDQNRGRDNDGTHGGTGHPNGPGSLPGDRPGKQVGTSRGEIDGTPVTPAFLHGEHGQDSWSGDRKDLPVPMLFLRAAPGDDGSRPVVGPFWESPDIFILGGVPPSAAPDVPTALGQTAVADQPNTVYAHIWNFGRGAAHEVFVEFWWLDPSLGVSPQGLHPIGQTTVALGARGSGNAHAVVKCPEPWTATFLNGGHECLLVRAWTVSDDVLGEPQWDASLNRHVGQRNIHVMSAGELAAAPPLQLQVGPLFGAPAVVKVERTAPTAMPWLQLHTGTRGLFPTQALATGTPTLTPPTTVGNAPAGNTAQQHPVHGDDQQVSFSSTDTAPGPGQANVYRVSAEQQGQVVGGYTVVVVG